MLFCSISVGFEWVGWVLCFLAKYVQYRSDSSVMQTNLEKEHVQEVYEAIAEHFSETRYKVC